MTYMCAQEDRDTEKSLLTAFGNCSKKKKKISQGITGAGHLHSEQMRINLASIKRKEKQLEKYATEHLVSFFSQAEINLQ